MDAAPAAPGQVLEFAPSGPKYPGIELLLVLGVSLGESAVYSVLSLVNKLTYEVPLNQQTTTVNPSYTPDRPWLDLAYQIANIVMPLVPALLALHLLKVSGERARIGFDLKRRGFDIGWGLLCAAGIGLPGLAFLAGAKALGLNTGIEATNLGAVWWTIPVLILAAVMNGVLEEVVMIGYFFQRAGNLGWHIALTVIVSALVRGSYHLYQGFGSFAGNFIMGVVFGIFYVKAKRVMPLAAAHSAIDIVAFVGYSLLAPYLTFI
ncbi:MAG: CPBP family intramembrane metalloprotease [Propionibacteriaceae bacterium]|jgi:membrane protease YdiL (CAAX protease family)|nr:CPBP family intramembrane metalloprotease [Propionibacteriaceae bacterium]